MHETYRQCQPDPPCMARQLRVFLAGLIIVAASFNIHNVISIMQIRPLEQSLQRAPSKVRYGSSDNRPESKDIQPTSP